MSKRIRAAQRLILSMSAQEKRAFRKSCERKTARYFKIFNLLDRHEEPPLGEVKSIPNWSNHLGSLWRHLIASLKTETADRPEFLLFEQLKESIVLMDKGMLESAERSFQNASALAREISILEVQLLINNYQHMLKQFLTEGNQKALSPIRQEREQLTSELILEQQVVECFVGAAVDKLTADKRAQLVELYKFLDSTKDGQVSLRLLSQINRAIVCLGSDSDVKGKNLPYLEQQLDLLNQHRSFLKTVPKYYLTVLRELVAANVKLGDYETALSYAQTFELVSCCCRFTEVFKFEAGCELNFDQLLESYAGNMQKQLYLQELEAGFLRYESSLRPNKAQLYRFKFALAYFGLANTTSAHEWAEAFAGNVRNSLSFSKQYRATIEVLIIAIHFEMGNFTLIYSMARNVYVRLGKSNRIDPITLTVLLFLKRHKFFALTEEEMLSELQFLSCNIELLASEEPNPNKGMQPDWSLWLNRLIQQKSGKPHHASSPTSSAE